MLILNFTNQKFKKNFFNKRNSENKKKEEEEEEEKKSQQSKTHKELSQKSHQSRFVNSYSRVLSIHIFH